MSAGLTVRLKLLLLQEALAVLVVTLTAMEPISTSPESQDSPWPRNPPQPMAAATQPPAEAGSSFGIGAGSVGSQAPQLYSVGPVRCGPLEG